MSGDRTAFTPRMIAFVATFYLDCHMIVDVMHMILDTTPSHFLACNIVLFPDPTLKEGKGLVYTERFLGRTAGCSMSCDWHDNPSLRHGNTSTALTHMQYTAIAQCHTIITYKPHGVNLIGATEFRNATSSSPRNRSRYTTSFPSLRVGSGNETTCNIKKLGRVWGRGILNIRRLLLSSMIAKLTLVLFESVHSSWVGRFGPLVCFAVTLLWDDHLYWWLD